MVRMATDVVYFLNPGHVGSLEGLHAFLKLLAKASGSDCQVLLELSTPDWHAIDAAASRQVDPLSKYRHNEWAVLECSVSTEDCIGESFPLLFAEPLVVADAARLSGWQCKVVLEDRNRHQALVRLTK
mmetsp:Transcript_60331/g.127771  ORF Transcript_60331/g.127771 Transcript_60331/m.127771 type:complete len:128 (-) Transcript_60331:138-521(-)